MLTIEDFFKPGGIIASVKPGFSPRPGQQELAEMNLKAMREGGQVLAEAATGFGKTYSVLVPAIIFVTENTDQRVVISTETLALQDQYANLDIPLLLSACQQRGVHFTYAAAKGRSNYICRKSYDEIEEDPFAPPEMRKWVLPLKVGTHSGDIASAPDTICDADLKMVRADEDCERSACKYYIEGKKGYTECFVYEAQKQYSEAQIVVANHTLMLLDALNGAGSLLGTYRVLVVDEAHTLPEKAQDCWGKTIKPRTVSYTVRLCGKMLGRVGIKDRLSGSVVSDYIEMEKTLFDCFHPLKFSSPIEEIKQRSVVDQAREAAKALVERLRADNRDLTGMVEEGEDSSRAQIVKSAKQKLSQIIGTLNAIFGDTLPEEHKDNWLSFVEIGIGIDGKKSATLHLKPIEVAPLMRGHLIDVLPACIFMSATLRIDGSFNFMRKEIGLALDEIEGRTFVGESSFDYASRVVGYFPEHLPDAKDVEEDTYLQHIALEVAQVIEHTKGGAMILFTNASHMREVYARVQLLTRKYPLLKQGDASKGILISKMKANTGLCLFATKSFFTGVDIPGQGLRCVVLVKCPFRVPSDPMFKAKCDKLESRGISSFQMLSLPLMLFDIQQAFGRLIRSHEDSGMFVFLDSRATKKPYGRKIKNALPGIKIRSALTGSPVRTSSRTIIEED